MLLRRCLEEGLCVLGCQAFRFMNAIIMPKFRDTGLYKMICMSFVVDDLEVGMPALPVNDRRSDSDDEEDGMAVLRSARAMAEPEASSSQGEWKKRAGETRHHRCLTRIGCKRQGAWHA